MQQFPRLDAKSSDPVTESPNAKDVAFMDEDGLQLLLHRTWNIVESFAVSFCALNFVGGVRAIFFLGLAAGGPAAVWSSYIITVVLMCITAAVLAEICSVFPLSGSIYIWAAQSAGPKYGRFFGFLVAWWSCTAWMTFVANNSQAAASYLVSILVVYDVEFPGGIDTSNVKWRAVIWAFSEMLFIMGIVLNYLPTKWYSRVFQFAIGLIMLDFVLCLTWLPIGVSRTYGFRSAKEVFRGTANGTGAPPVWNWMLSFVFTVGTLVGFDASGHIAEETKNASIIAPRGLFSSVVASGVLGFAATLLFLFCVPDSDTLLTLHAPQPFVQIYTLALGRRGAIFMSLLASVGLILTTSMVVVAGSRLLLAVARDGALPGSKWIGQVTHDGQPRNAVTVMFIFGAAILCTILPSQVAFASLVSAGGVLNIAAYALIASLRLIFTPNSFLSTRFKLGIFRKPFYVATAIFNTFVLAVMLSPLVFPVSKENFNFSCVILGATSIFAALSWWFMPDAQWLRKDRLGQMYNAAENSNLQITSRTS
ncbi:gamma-aminobutyric acid transporter [Hysterangium stoloniferum]|nr:gamma-aminobutyric acid transporter [Hysterangium stoloniferum]